jgi:hypothetical protein
MSKITRYYLVLGIIWASSYELTPITTSRSLGEKDLPAQSARHRAAGLLGSRVVVEPWDISTLPPYFANLIVSDELLTTGTVTVTRDELEHVLRPARGTIVAGRPGDGGTLQWWTFKRPKLEQAGSWTQCGNLRTPPAPMTSWRKDRWESCGSVSRDRWQWWKGMPERRVRYPWTAGCLSREKS